MLRALFWVTAALVAATLALAPWILTEFQVADMEWPFFHGDWRFGWMVICWAAAVLCGLNSGLCWLQDASNRWFKTTATPPPDEFSMTPRVGRPGGVLEFPTDPEDRREILKRHREGGVEPPSEPGPRRRSHR